MKNIIYSLLSLLLLCPIVLLGQNVGINTSTPDASALLDMVSTDRGVLVPRMTSVQKNSIVSPATGLLVFDLTTSSFWFYNSAIWVEVGAGGGGGSSLVDADNDTKIQVEKFADEDKIRFDLAGAEHWVMQGARLEPINSGRSVFIGEDAGLNDDLSTNYNVFIGYNAGKTNTSGNNNNAIGVYALYSNTTGGFNTAIGHSSLFRNTTGNNNNAIGYNALNRNTTGSNNTAAGNLSLNNNTTGNRNTALGHSSLRGNTTGSYNTANGFYALNNNTTGSSNAANGYQALSSNTTGVANSAFGDNALGTNSTGNFNSAMGRYALYRNTTGIHNTASGHAALFENTTASYNTANGYYALRNNTTGQYNTAVGYYAFQFGTIRNNSTALGYNTNITASNQIRLGNNTVTSIGGFANWTNVSDARFKTNIKENVVGLDFIMKLRPVTYNLEMDAIANFFNTPDSLRLLEAEKIKANEIQTGFIAQEIEEAAQQINYDFSGVDAPKNDNDHYGLRYAEFVVPLVKATQEQQQIIEAQQETISKYKKMLLDMEKRLRLLEKAQ